MFILGLTGSIGMGKSATAAMFRARGIPVHDADTAVHALYRGAAVPVIAKAFPQAVINGVVDRAKLSAAVIGKPEALKTLEQLVHPLVRAVEQDFLHHHRQNRAGLVVLDIPLLFETGGDRRCDAILVVTASEQVQYARVMARPGMTLEKFRAILSRQMPDVQKRSKAHFLVDTSHGFPAAQADIGSICQALAGRSGSASRWIDNA
jgi:dephospho-CoA kinase